MPTSKYLRSLYKEKFIHLESRIIDRSDYIKDKHNLFLYKTKCPVCFVDRGYLRYSQIFVPCKKCGQSGKTSPRRGVTLSEEIRAKISLANKNRILKSLGREPLTKEEKKIVHSIRSRLWQGLKGLDKSISTLTLLGCPISELKLHLESKFHPNSETGEIMTWDNYGRYGWHIDHIRPLASFNLTDPEQLKEACHYSNLQPLWWFENLKKGNKYEQR